MSRVIFEPSHSLAATDAIGRLCHNSRMEKEFKIDEALQRSEAMNGVPDFYEIPEEQRTVIEKTTLVKERMFWLRATHLDKNATTETLLRRAVYAETRCFEMENMAAEMALITSGAADRVRELEGQLDKLSKAIG